MLWSGFADPELELQVTWSFIERKYSRPRVLHKNRQRQMVQIVSDLQRMSQDCGKDGELRCSIVAGRIS